MAFDKNFPNRKDKVKSYFGTYKSSNWDRTCRPNGSCHWCRSNRLHSRKKSAYASLQDCRQDIDAYYDSLIEHYTNYIPDVEVDIMLNKLRSTTCDDIANGHWSFYGLQLVDIIAGKEYVIDYLYPKFIPSNVCILEDGEYKIIVLK